MNKTRQFQTDKQLTTDINGLQAMLGGTGRQTAKEIAQAAGAVLTIGRRKLYHIPKIENYLSNLTEQQ